MLVTMTALSDRQVILKGAKDQRWRDPAPFGPNHSVAGPVSNRRRGAEPINPTRGTVRPEGSKG
jgi:hypothetical protein